MANSIVNNFEIPNWAGKPPPGLHLDVMKETKMVQKLMIDEKKCYFFGRNKQLCDFSIEHGSCSRVHAALVWHKHLNRPFIIDLGSTHGTFIGTIRLENKKPQQVPIDSMIHFGESTRKYVIRERPQAMTSALEDGGTEDVEGGLLGLPETETELDNLTEFNTAHNRRITALSDLPDAAPAPKLKRRRASVRFNEDEEVINPEDIDPSVGRFRNLVSTLVVPKKKPRLEGPAPTMTDTITKRLQNISYAGNLYSDLPGEGTAEPASPTSPGSMGFVSKLGLRLPNLAPDVDDTPTPEIIVPALQPTVGFALDTQTVAEQQQQQQQQQPHPNEPKKKKYAKEAWPGKKPVPSLLV